MILFVVLEVLGKLINTLAQESYLHFRGARIGIVDPVFVNNVRFDFLAQWHVASSLPASYQSDSNTFSPLPLIRVNTSTRVHSAQALRYFLRMPILSRALP
jgi:hypothetical protein